MRIVNLARWIGAIVAFPMCFAVAPGAEAQRATPELDGKVQAFLSAERGRWDYLNVPYQDGQILHELVVKGGHKRILEIGTLTGHSTVWLAWAAAKTGANAPGAVCTTCSTGYDASASTGTARASERSRNTSASPKVSPGPTRRSTFSSPLSPRSESLTMP